LASAEELIQAAYFELQNVTPGATDEERRRSRAIRLAKSVLRKYPVSIEARQARSILRQLKIDDSVRRFVDTHSHSNDAKPLAITTMRRRPESGPTSEPVSRPGLAPKPLVAPADTDWRSLWQLFTALPYLQKRILIFILMFIALFVAFTPFVLIFAFLLLIKRDAIKPLIHRILVSMNPKSSQKRFQDG
jgi:hypothetical protein